MRRRTPYIDRNTPHHPLAYARKLFRDNNITPGPGTELADYVAAASTCMHDEDLEKFLRAQKRFDGPVRLLETGRTVQHWKLRNTLQQLPNYMHAAETAQLDYTQANVLHRHMLRSVRHEFHQPELTTHLMARAYTRAATAGLNLSHSYATLKDLISVTADNGIIDGALYALSILLRLGLTVEQSYDTIKRHTDADGTACGYVIPHFNDAIKSMLPAKVNPDHLFQVLNTLGGERPWFQLRDYTEFRSRMTFECPSRGITPNELLANMAAQTKKDPNTQTALVLHDETSPRATFNPTTYFIEVSGQLEHVAQPYKNKRTLNDGIRDLEKLATASTRYWEEIGEGMWVFDPAQETWYSLGGKLLLPGMTSIITGQARFVRHEFLPQDISQLSKTPYLFHIHPEALDVFIAPDRDQLSEDTFKEHLTKFLTATPSRADYGIIIEFIKEQHEHPPVPTRSFIAHALGMTEFTYPDRIIPLAELREHARDIRDQAMLEFNVAEYVWRHGVQMPIIHLVSKLVQDLDNRLPAGFGITLHPTGTLFNTTPSAEARA